MNKKVLMGLFLLILWVICLVLSFVQGVSQLSQTLTIINIMLLLISNIIADWGNK